MKYLVILLVSCLSSFAAERTWNKEVSVNNDVRFSVSNHKGLLKISVGDSGVITMNARVYMPEDADYTEEEAQKAIDAMEFNLQEGARSVSLDVEMDDRFQQGWSGLFKRKNFTHPMVDLVITVPSEASLDLETHKGTLEVDAPSGRVDLNTHKGTGYLRGVKGDLEIVSHKGNLEVEVARMGDISIETHKGTFDVTVYGAQDFRIDADSHKGNFTFDGYDIQVDHEDKGESVRHKQGSGANRIKLDTHKGDIHFRFK